MDAFCSLSQAAVPNNSSLDKLAVREQKRLIRFTRQIGSYVTAQQTMGANGVPSATTFDVAIWRWPNLYVPLKNESGD